MNSPDPADQLPADQLPADQRSAGSGAETTHCDVLVIGSGPSGSSCAYWLAKAGHDVVLVERKAFPREKTCGDGLTPRSVRQLEDMGLGPELSSAHRWHGLRSHGFGRTLEMAWPDVKGMPTYGYVVTRKDLDGMVAGQAAKAGAQLWEHTEAVELVVQGSEVRGARVVAKGDDGHTGTVMARYVVLAEGANSRLGWALGNKRDRNFPQGMALRGYWTSPRHDEPWIDSWLDLRDEKGSYMPGYGWIFPMGDGRVNVGVGLLTTSDRWKGANTTQMLDAFVKFAPASWDLRPETCLGPATGGRLPMGLSVNPRSGPSHLVVGDSAGMISPFNGEGIAYGYETGRMAAGVLDEALTRGDARLLGEYEKRLDAEYGMYYRLARAFVRAISQPQVMRACVMTGMYSRPLMEWLLRIMSNMLRPEETGIPELAYKALVGIARFKD
ncbi:MAG TPA: geranylgeranyl reductase family protein [Acidimicrobiales bacterium]|nr:geranylgeranyl reductase family protein [Acidimicrobiales bacterium]